MHPAQPNTFQKISHAPRQQSPSKKNIKRVLCNSLRAISHAMSRTSIHNDSVRTWVDKVRRFSSVSIPGQQKTGMDLGGIGVIGTTSANPTCFQSAAFCQAAFRESNSCNGGIVWEAQNLGTSAEKDARILVCSLKEMQCFLR